MLHRARILRRYGLTEPGITRYLQTLADQATIAVVADPPDVVSADPKDNHVLAAAAVADADLIVTGDLHLLRLHPYGDISILTPAYFLADLIHRSPPPDKPEAPESGVNLP